MDLVSPEALRAWQAERHVTHDVVTPALVDRYLVTLGHRPQGLKPGAPAPLGLHWCLGPEAAAMEDLGPDGLPERGGIIPPVPLAARMWAGGDLDFAAPLRVGDAVERVAALSTLTEKAGRAGRLAFLGIDYDYRVDGAVRLHEVQRIVCREPAPLDLGQAAPEHDGPWAFRRRVATSAPMLLRFSSLTFNPHRIHYDLPYATGTEGYPGLLVHGTLTAALLLDTCAAAVGIEAIARVTLRARRPAFCGTVLTLAGQRGPDVIRLVALDGDGLTVMDGSATLRAATNAP